MCLQCWKFPMHMLVYDIYQSINPYIAPMHQQTQVDVHQWRKSHEKRHHWHRKLKRPHLAHKIRCSRASDPEEQQIAGVSRLACPPGPRQEMPQDVRKHCQSSFPIKTGSCGSLPFRVPPRKFHNNIDPHPALKSYLDTYGCPDLNYPQQPHLLEDIFRPLHG